MEDQVPVNEWACKKKRKIRKEDVIKNAKIKGLEHVNHVEKFVRQC